MEGVGDDRLWDYNPRAEYVATHREGMKGKGVVKGDLCGWVKG